jgi:ubiquinone/menaquinone biosynthesis C-methylase UbiE/uncharacterized protein YbaR (Trm112 family)
MTSLSCTKCKGPLKERPESYYCSFCDISYPVVNNIPIMVLDSFLDSHIKQQIEYFSKEPASVEEEYTLSPWQQSYVDRFLDNFGDVKDKWVLDGGSGSGYMTIELAKRGAHVVSADVTYSSVMRLARLRDKFSLKNDIEIVCCDMQELPFKDNVFDFYISNAVLEHLPNDMKAISEISRVCKKKGAGVLVVTPILYKYLTKILIPINYLHDKRIGHLRRYDLGIMRSKFKGWDVKKTYYTGHFSKVVKTLINMIFPVFEETCLEVEDSKLTNTKEGSSNIVVLFER